MRGQHIHISGFVVYSFLGEELYDFGLLKHQIVAVFPGAVISSKKFFVHIEPDRAQSISQQIADLVAQPEVDDFFQKLYMSSDN